VASDADELLIIPAASSNRELTLPKGSSRKQEMADIHARDHQHHGNNGTHER